MKFIRYMLAALVWVLAAASGFWLIYQSVIRVCCGGWFGVWGDAFLASPSLQASIGMATLTMALLLVFSLLCPSGKARYLEIDQPGGKVRISLDAVRDYLARTGSENPDVISVRPGILVERNGALKLNCVVRVRAGTPLPEISALLRDQLKSAIRHQLGLPHETAITVTVREIQRVPGEEAPASREPSVRAPRPGEDELIDLRDGAS